MQQKELDPPPFLYHGTAEKYLDSIWADGIKKQSRNFVHLSADPETAYHIGERHGKAVVLKIDAEGMYRDGYVFYLSESGIRLTDFVLPRSILPIS